MELTAEPQQSDMVRPILTARMVSSGHGLGSEGVAVIIPGYERKVLA